MGLLLPYFYLDLSYPHRFKLFALPLPSLSPLPPLHTLLLARATNANLLPPTYSSLGQGIAFLEPAHHQGAKTTFQTNYGLDLMVQMSGNPRESEEQGISELNGLEEESVLTDE